MEFNRKVESSKKICNKAFLNKLKELSLVLVLSKNGGEVFRVSLFKNLKTK